jgi:hypothetical protein
MNHELFSCEVKYRDSKDIVKTVQKCLNKSVANLKAETLNELRKLPLVICSKIV